MRTKVLQRFKERPAFWQCAACDTDWVRAPGGLFDQDERCLRCDGVLGPVEEQASRKSGLFRTV